MTICETFAVVFHKGIEKPNKLNFSPDKGLSAFIYPNRPIKALRIDEILNQSKKYLEEYGSFTNAITPLNSILNDLPNLKNRFNDHTSKLVWKIGKVVYICLLALRIKRTNPYKEYVTLFDNAHSEFLSFVQKTLSENG